jgi:hypothetical protein
MRPVIPDSGDGFAVDPATLGGVAGDLGRAYDDLNTAYGDLLATAYAGDDASVFGAPEVVTAWNQFCSAFFGEFEEDLAAVAELINKLMTSAQKYTENEARTADLMNATGRR